MKVGIKRIVLISLFVMAAAIGMAQDWGAAFYWDIRTKAANAVVLRRVGTIDKPFGTQVVLEVDAFAGSDMDANLLGGFSVGKTFAVAENVDFKFAVGVATQQNKPTGAGLILGLAWRF